LGNTFTSISPPVLAATISANFFAAKVISELSGSGVDRLNVVLAIATWAARASTEASRKEAILRMAGLQGIGYTK
jgi:hypothetical protein